MNSLLTSQPALCACAALYNKSKDSSFKSSPAAAGWLGAELLPPPPVNGSQKPPVTLVPTAGATVVDWPVLSRMNLTICRHNTHCRASQTWQQLNVGGQALAFLRQVIPCCTDHGSSRGGDVEYGIQALPIINSTRRLGRCALLIGQNTPAPCRCGPRSRFVLRSPAP